MHVGEAAQEPPVAGEDREPFRAHLTQHPTRVPVAALPQIGVDGFQQLLRVGMPRPAKVVDDIA